MKTGLLRARDGPVLAMFPNPSLVALAPVASVVDIFDASTPVEAGRILAVADLIIAVISTKSRWALAGVEAVARIEAGAPVLAGLMVRTVIEVLVAEEASPTFVT